MYLLLACVVTPKIPLETGVAVDSGHQDTEVTETGDTAPPPDTAPDVPFAIPDFYVDCRGGGDFTRIQDAINAAVSPARIEVAPCTYTERLDFLGKVIDLYSTEGSGETVVDGQQGGTVVNLEAYESGWSRMAGFTVTGGYDTADAAAFELTGSSLELSDVVITGNVGLSMLRGNGASVDLNQVIIEGNTVNPEGQAIYVDSGGVNVANSVINCDGGTQGIWHHVQLILADSQVRCDTGYGVWDYHGEDHVVRSVLYGGVAGYHAADTQSTPEEPDTPRELFIVENSVLGGGQFGAEVLYMHLELSNSVFYGATSALAMTECDSGSSSVNNVYTAGACGITGDQAFSDSYSAFWKNEADGCGVNVRPRVTDDPLFVNFPDDVSLLIGSPLIDAGDPRYSDTDGSRSDIGRYGGERGGW